MSVCVSAYVWSVCVCVFVCTLAIFLLMAILIFTDVLLFFFAVHEIYTQIEIMNAAKEPQK